MPQRIILGHLQVNVHLGTISHCGATQRHASAKYSMMQYTCLRLASCSRKLGLLDTPSRERVVN